MVANFIVAIKSKFDVEQLQGDIDALMKWSKLWILSFNILKSKLETLVLILILIYFHINNCCSKLTVLICHCQVTLSGLRLFKWAPLLLPKLLLSYGICSHLMVSQTNWYPIMGLNLHRMNSQVL